MQPYPATNVSRLNKLSAGLRSRLSRPGGRQRAAGRRLRGRVLGMCGLILGLVCYTAATTAAPPGPALAPTAARPDARAASPWAIGAAPLPWLFLQGGPETIATFASNCTTPKTTFTLGETVCAKVTGAPLGPAGAPARRLTWVARNGTVVRTADITLDPQTGTFMIPNDPTETVGGVTVDYRGTWTVNTNYAADGAVNATAVFSVRDPGGNYANLAINQAVSLSDAEVGTPGSNGTIGSTVTNLGPDTAQTVSFTQPVPADTTFVSFTQVSGPPFTCTTPAPGGTGAVVCTLSSLAKDAAASFQLVYQVNTGSNGAISTTGSVSSATAELDPSDNTAAGGVALPGGGPPVTCSVSCPGNITQNNDPNQAGAIVDYPAPTTSDSSCGAVTCDHPSGSFFPVGNTTVVCEADTGDSCSFLVTVNDTRALTITLNGQNPLGVECHTVFTDPGVTATSTDPNATVTTSVSGTVDANTPGSYTLTYTATDGTRTASVTRTVLVEDTTPPTITLNGANPQTVECHTPYVDPGVSATDSCAGDLTSAVVVTGSVDPNVPGSYTLTYTVQDPANNQATIARAVTVVDTTPPVITLNGANPQTVECHTPFVDPGATALDSCAGDFTSAIVVTGSVDANTPGSYTLTYTVSDGPNTGSVTRIVNVVDTTPPVITLNGQTLELWPPNHKYHTVTVADFVASASDICDAGVTRNSVVIAKVTSDEPENAQGGDGNTMNDMVIAPDCKSVQVRAERDGNRNGRVYTITFRVRDAAGNVTTAQAKVTVPKSQGAGAAVDDGPQYTVNGTCP